MPFAIKDILMRWFMPCRDKKGTLLILNEKYKKSFKGITEKEILTVIHAVMEYISNLYSCANLPISWGKQLLPNWRMQQTRQMMNTTHTPPSQLLSWWDDAGANCIVSQHVVCSLRHNQTPGTIARSPDIQAGSVARMVTLRRCSNASNVSTHKTRYMHSPHETLLFSTCPVLN